MGEIETTSKCRPILFSGPMVRALLEGRKTMTRRVMKARGCGGKQMPMPAGIDSADIAQRWAKGCPYGKPGDRLRVNETWGTRQWWDSTKPKELPVLPGSPHCEVFFAADGPNKEVKRWRSPFFLPPVASRILLEIKAVRVERLDAITEEDAKAEGVPPALRPPGLERWEEKGWEWQPYTTEFRGLWEDLYGYGSWEKNPWVWVVEFERVKP